MAKNKIRRRTNKPLNIFADGGDMQLSDQIGAVGGAVGSVLGAGLSNAKIADTSGIEGSIKQQSNMVVGASNNDQLMNEWSSWTKLKDDYSAKDIRGLSTGQLALNTLTATANGAGAGAQVGGPIEGIIGGAVGLGAAVGGWFSGNRKARKKARKLNRLAREANERSLSSFETRASNIDTQNDLGLLANYSAFGGYLPLVGSQAINYSFAERDLNNQELQAMGKLKLTSLPNSFGKEYEGLDVFANGGGLSRSKDYGSKEKPYPSVKSSDFAGSGRSYPIPTIADARDALRLAGLHGRSDVKAKVYKKYPSLKHAYGGVLYADGGGIHIKKANRGKFTEYCGGKVTNECIARGKKSPSPTIRKRATFAQNARKWHALGGPLYTPYSTAGEIYLGAYDSETEYPDMFQHGGDFGDGVTIVGNGGSHEDNPLTGVPMGVSPDGTPNLVEEGEVIFNDYVFSNRLSPTASLLKQYNLPTKYKDYSFAKIAEMMNKEPKERPEDPISRRGLLANMSKLMQAQEDIKYEKEQVNIGKQFALGGPFDFEQELFALPYKEWSMIPQTTEPIQKISTVAPRRTQPIIREAPMQVASLPIQGIEVPELSYQLDIPTRDAVLGGEALGIQDTVDEGNLSWLRYAPVVGSGISVLSDLFGGNAPDYEGADMVLNAIQGIPEITASPIGNYLTYRPLDRDYYINKLNKNAAATRRALQNTSGGNRLQAQAGIIAADYNYGENLGSLARQAEEYNQQQRERVEAFNRGTNQFNTETAMRAAIADQARREMQIRGVMTAAQMRDAARRESDAARDANLTNFFESLSSIGQEEFSRALINQDPSRNYKLSRSGKTTYKGKKKAKGGLLS